MSPQVTHTPPKRSTAFPVFNGHAASPARRRVSPPLLATGVVVVVLCALAIGSLYSGAAQRDLVLAVARPVPIGTPITDADIRDVEVAAGPGAATIPATRRSSVVGQRPAVALVPGALLAPAQLQSGTGPEKGQALVALALRPGQFPPEVVPGDVVRIISTGAPPPSGSLSSTAFPSGTPPDASRSSTTSLLAEGTVVSIRPVAEAPGTTVVSLRLAEADAPAVLRAGAGVGLVVTGRQP